MNNQISRASGNPAAFEAMNFAMQALMNPSTEWTVVRGSTHTPAPPERRDSPSYIPLAFRDSTVPVPPELSNPDAFARAARVELSGMITELANDRSISHEEFYETLSNWLSGTKHVSISFTDFHDPIRMLAALQVLSEARGIETLAIQASMVPKIGEPLVMVLRMVQLNNPNIRDFRVGLKGSDVKDKHIEELRSIRGITMLDLSNNRLTQRSGPVVAGLPNLTSLDISDNDFKTTGFNHLSALTRLTELHANRNAIKSHGVTALRGMRGLSKLSLDRNRLDNDVNRYLPRLPSLNSVSMANNGLKAVTLMNTLSQNGARNFSVTV